jgi:phytoene dehydrogenase-like protein
MSSSNTFDVIVIGAGANGLVAAAALARAGRRVLLLESAESIGGQARSVEIAPGFSAPLDLDAGWLPPSVARGLGLGVLATEAPDVAVALAAGDGDVLAVPRDADAAADAIRPRSPRDAARWGAFVARLAHLAGFLETLYQQAPPDIGANALSELGPLIRLGREFRALGRSDMTELLRVLPMPIQDLLDDTFENEALKAAVAAGGVRDLRQGPRSGGTSFVLLHHMVGAPSGGVCAREWWRDGPHAFDRAVEMIAQSAGVTVRTGARVARIEVRDDAVTGVVLDGGEECMARSVLSTADPSRTLLGMVDPVWLDPEFLRAVANIKYRGCTALVYYALDRLPDVARVSPANAASVLAGSVSLTATTTLLERAADAAKYGAVSEAPHVEITVPSLRWPSCAPPGRHVLVARAQFAPFALADGQAWDAARSGALTTAVTAIVARAMPHVADHVLHRTTLTPRDLESRFGLTGGALTHGELTLDQILFMRPVAGWGRYAMPVRGLYLGGCGAHPGPGVLGGAGWLAARRMIMDG